MPPFFAIWRSCLGSLFCFSLCLAVVFAREDSPKPVASAPDKSPATDLDRKIIKEIQDHSEVQPNLTYISDVIGSRMTGSENLKKANQWALNEPFGQSALTNPPSQM